MHSTKGNQQQKAIWISTSYTYRPHPEKPSAIRAAAHAVVTCSVAPADHDGQLGHVRARNCADHLRAVLRDAALLGVLSDHESADVLQEDQWDVALGAQLDEVSSLETAFAE